VTERDPSRVQSVERAAALLRAIGAAPPRGSTVAELARSTGLNRATAWRLLKTLEEEGLVTYAPGQRLFGIGPMVLDLARSQRAETLVARAHRAIRELSLQTRESVALGVFRESRLLFIDQARPTDCTADTWLGQSTGPMHATSSGKVLLAFHQTQDELLHRQRLESFTDSTITTGRALREELATVRSQGYALSRGEYQANVWGVSAPLLEDGLRLVGVLSLWGPAMRREPERVAALGTLARDTAADLIAI
jgi:IclR family acetate operon transcriptional repressor